DLLQPADPLRRPDPAAYTLLAEARKLARGDALRARLLFEMARAAQAQGQAARAVSDFQAYLDDYPEGADRFAARFHLGEALLAVRPASTGFQAVGVRAEPGAGGARPDASPEVRARLTWADLARDLRDRAEHDPEAAAIRAQALYRIARTYGIPTPRGEAELALGVAALRRLVAAHPRHPLAVTASYEIGVSYRARGQDQPALHALRAFLKGEGFRAESDEARSTRTRLAMAATFQFGEILHGQQRYDEAIAAFQSYLAQFPDGPQSADAQRAVLDAQLRIAQQHQLRQEYAPARAAWEAFVARNPLDPRVPGVLFQLGESLAEEKKFAEAIAAWEALAGKFPGTEPAAHARFRIAQVIGVEQGNPDAAIERFRRVDGEPWGARARQEIAVAQSQTLTVVTPRAVRSGEAARLTITTRNVAALSFSAYKLDAEAFFRKKHALKGVEALDVGLVAPAAAWTADVPGFARHRLIEAEYDLKPVAVPGVWVVKVAGGPDLQATTLVLGSDLDSILKASRDQVLALAQDMTTGRPRPGARVLVADGAGIVLEAETGPDGVVLKDWDRPREPGSGLEYLVIDGSHV
ncbi:MAG TPA: tetratricopeptide repeat protein, partial [Isosphaeraceae bacterium]